jgi:hypothetical protein
LSNSRAMTRKPDSCHLLAVWYTIAAVKRHDLGHTATLLNAGSIPACAISWRKHQEGME